VTTAVLPPSTTPPLSARPPSPCMSRHYDNVGRPRPPVRWVISYGCAEGHTVTGVEVCDRCATSLVDGDQRCVHCLAPMHVSSLTELA
jgi:hypothetical protein